MRSPRAFPSLTRKPDVDDSEETYVHAALKYTTGPFKILLSEHYQDEYAAGQSGDTEGVGHVPDGI